jgi:uncharacterized membrane protein
MQPQVSKIFGSYDLFAKAFPGILFISLSLSLLPAPSIETFPQSSGILIAVLALFVIIFGFVAGQALHAVAVQIESVVLKIGRWLYIGRKLLIILSKWAWDVTLGRILHRIQNHRNKNNGSEESNHPEGDNNQEPEISTPKLIVVLAALIFAIGQVVYYVLTQQFGVAIFLILSFVFPLHRIKNGAIQTFYPHRRLFKDKISEGGETVNKFVNSIEELFNIDAEENLELSYQLVMSYYERITVGRSRQHQANFSFCKSTWTTLLLFSIIYLIIADPAIAGLIGLLGPFLSGYIPLEYSPIIAILIPKTTIKLIGTLMLVSVLLFMEGERQGKKAFIEYVFIDILTINEGDLPEATQQNR